MSKFIAVLALVASTVSMAERLPVDEAIDGLRAKAEHLEKLKTLFSSQQCSITVGNNTVALSAGALRDNGFVMAITDTIPGQYLAYSSAPKPQLLKNVVQYTFKQAVNRVFIVSSSFASANGQDITHLQVKVAEPVLQKDIQDPATLQPTYTYEQYPVAIPLDQVKSGLQTKTKTLKTGGEFSISCK